MRIKIYIKMLLVGISLVLVNTCKLYSFVAPQSTNQNEYPNRGNAIYRDLHDPVLNIVNYGHTAIFYKYGSPGDSFRLVIQANGKSGPSGINTWSGFLGQGKSTYEYWGAYTQERIDSVNADEIIRVAEEECLNITYAFCWGHYKDPTGYGGTPALRCDGLVEYCYEKAFGEGNIPSYKSPNQGIVPNDYSVDNIFEWILPYTVAACYAHNTTHTMCPCLQMEWINEGYNDGHEGASAYGRQGRNSVPNIVTLDTTLVFDFSSGKKGHKEAKGKIREAKSIRINKIPSFAQPMNSKEHKLYTCKEIDLNNSKNYKEITLNKPIKKGNSKGEVTLSNDFEGPFKVYDEGAQVGFEMTKMVPAQPCTLKYFYVWFYNYDSSQQTKNCGFVVAEDNGGVPSSTFLFAINADITQDAGECLCWKIPVSNGLVFNGPFWVGHCETTDGAPTSVYDSIVTPGTNFFCDTTMSNEWTEDAYDYLHAAVVAYGTGGDTIGQIGQDLRITNNGLAPLKINYIYSYEPWVKKITPDALFILPYDTAIVNVKAARGTYTTSQEGWLYVSPQNDVEARVRLRLELGGPPVKDTIPPSIIISQPDSGNIWKIGENDTILWAMYDNNGTIIHCQIEYSTNSGTNWNTLLDTSDSFSSGVWYQDWNIPNVFSKTCLIRVSATDSSGNGSKDTSNLFTISNDTTPPPAPVNITANGSNPSPLQDSATFTINWTNPYDNSGIAGMWCKLDSLPSYSSDGFYGDIKDKPFKAIIDSLWGTHMLYVWLEDSSGNKNHLNAASVELRRQQVGVEDNKFPDKFVLFSPAPNPSLRNVIIKYGLPEEASISLKLYDISGRVVKSFHTEMQAKGYYNVKIEGLSLGVYFIKFAAGNFKATKKLMILR
ncbi:MAG: T9SS type A sorting domain-containing protein [bacterium]